MKLNKKKWFRNRLISFETNLLQDGVVDDVHKFHKYAFWYTKMSKTENGRLLKKHFQNLSDFEVFFESIRLKKLFLKEKRDYQLEVNFLTCTKEKRAIKRLITPSS